MLGGGLLLLAIVNVRNAWDLTLSMVRRHRRRTTVALVELAHLHFHSRLYLGQNFHAADRLGKNVARACKARFISLGDRRAAESDRDRRTLAASKRFLRA